MTSNDADPAATPAAAPEVTPPAPAPRTWGSLAARWVPVVLVVCGCIYLARTVDLAQLRTALLAVTVWPLGLALVCAALMVVSKATYWWLLVNTSSPAPVSLRAMVVYSFASSATNTFLPMRAGDALRLWLVQRRHGVPVLRSAAIIALEKVGDIASLLILVTPLPWLIPNLPPSVAEALRILPCIVLAGVVAIGIASRSAVRWTFLQGFAVIRRPGVVAAGFACILASWVLDIGSILSVLLAVHAAPAIGKALVVILTVNIAVAIPATPGQVGAHEIASTFALGLFGVPEPQAIAFAFLYHATQLLPTLLIGLTTARALARAPDAPPSLAASLAKKP